jgi:hypothetical protein
VGGGSDGIALVKRRETLKLALCKVQVLVFAQYRYVKAAALHLNQLVNQHVAGSSQFALKTEAAAQQEGLAESPAIGELGKVQVNAQHAVKGEAAGINIIGKFNHSQAISG